MSDYDELYKLQESWSSDPLACAYTLWIPKGERLYRQQEEIIVSTCLKPETFVKSGHGLGKTYTAALATLTFLSINIPSKVITTAPSWNQVEFLLWSEIRDIYNNSPCYKMGLPFAKNPPLKTYWEIDENWFAIGISPMIEKEGDARRGTGFHSKNILVIFDEGPAVNPKLWMIKDTLLTSQNTHFLAIGNPVDSSGNFYKGFQDTNNKRFTLNIFETPNFIENKITAIEQLRELAKMPIEERNTVYNKFKYPYPALSTIPWAVIRLIKWGEQSPLFQSRVLANFPTKASDSLIALADLEACEWNKIEEKESAAVLACDPARFGSDDTVIYGIKNSKEAFKEKINGQDLIKTAKQLKFISLRDRYRKIIVDEVGIGAGVIDWLRDVFKGIPDMPTVIGVNNGSAPSREYADTCKNLITELYVRADKLFKAREIGIKDTDELFAQLANRKYDYDGKGLMVIEPKEDYKKRTGQGSPDEADALLLAIYGLMLGSRKTHVSASEERKIVGDWQ